MKEFVFKLNHLHNVYPDPKLPLEVRLAKRWIVQLYIPEFKLTHLENGKLNEFFINADNRFIVKWGQWSFAFGFNLMGFGFGVSRKTDEMMELDAKQILSMQKNIGA
jgi:hypothetical protein